MKYIFVSCATSGIWPNHAGKIERTSAMTPVVFPFVVRYLGFLKHVPLLPWLFDAMLMSWYLVFDPAVPEAIGRIEETVSRWKGVQLSLHRFGGLQFNLGGRELGHLHSNGMLDVLFPRQVKARMMKENIVSNHHVFENSGWVSFHIRRVSDVSRAIHLLALAYRLKEATSLNLNGRRVNGPFLYYREAGGPRPGTLT